METNLGVFYSQKQRLSRDTKEFGSMIKELKAAFPEEAELLWVI